MKITNLLLGICAIAQIITAGGFDEPEAAVESLDYNQGPDQQIQNTNPKMDRMYTKVCTMRRKIAQKMLHRSWESVWVSLSKKDMKKLERKQSQWRKRFDSHPVIQSAYSQLDKMKAQWKNSKPNWQDMSKTNRNHKSADSCYTDDNSCGNQFYLAKLNPYQFYKVIINRMKQSGSWIPSIASYYESIAKTMVTSISKVYMKVSMQELMMLAGDDWFSLVWNKPMYRVNAQLPVFELLHLLLNA